jgi:predicted acyl esterase
MKHISSNETSLAPRARTRRGRALDTLTAHIFKMPAGHQDYAVTRGLRVPMRDGAELLTDLYSPLSGSLGTLLIRGPYGRSGFMAMPARYPL